MISEDVIIRKIHRIKNDFINGSTVIAIKSLHILDEAAKIYTTNDDYIKLNHIAELLKSAKPSMAAMNNLINKYLDLHRYKLKHNSENNTLDEVLNYIYDATKKTINKAISKVFSLSDNIKIMSCSYSSTFIKFLEQSTILDYKPELYSVESRWDEQDYAQKLCEKASKFDLNTNYVPLSELQNKIKDVDCVIVGADSFNPDIGAINGCPSLRLAQIAFQVKPFYIIAESFKRATHLLPAEGFDFITIELIIQIFSD